MKKRGLTASLPDATATGMDGLAARTGRNTRGAIALVLAAAMSGCINVAAPDKPIVIELNINIRQEVVYRLAEDAANTIEEHADIF